MANKSFFSGLVRGIADVAAEKRRSDANKKERSIRAKLLEAQLEKLDLDKELLEKKLNEPDGSTKALNILNKLMGRGQTPAEAPVQREPGLLDLLAGDLGTGDISQAAGGNINLDQQAPLPDSSTPAPASGTGDFTQESVINFILSQGNSPLNTKKINRVANGDEFLLVDDETGTVIGREPRAVTGVKTETFDAASGQNVIRFENPVVKGGQTTKQLSLQPGGRSGPGGLLKPKRELPATVSNELSDILNIAQMMDDVEKAHQENPEVFGKIGSTINKGKLFLPGQKADPKMQRVQEAFSTIQTLFNVVAKLRSGAVLNAEEIRRLEKEIPREGDEFNKFRGKVSAFKRILRQSLENKKDLLGRSNFNMSQFNDLLGTKFGDTKNGRQNIDGIPIFNIEDL